MATPTLAGSPSIRHLEQLVDGLTAGVILVDPSGTILFANPAALAMHGCTEAKALGATADEYCARFSLRHRNGHRLARREYPIIRMLAGESFPDIVVDVTPVGSADHDGGAPQWTHTVHDVVMDEDGGEPDMLALVIQDVSERYDAEERFEAMFQANPAPAVIMRLDDQRFIRANQGFLELCGHGHDRIVGRTLRDYDILARAERRQHIGERLEAGATIPQVETELALPGGESKLVILAGQPIEVANQKCMLFTFADLEPRRRAETALRASERHFQTVFRMAPVAMAITSDTEGRIVEANDAFRRVTGYTTEELLGRVADDLQLWHDADQRRRLEGEIAHGGGLRNHDVRLLPKDGDPVDCLLSAERIALRGDQCVVWLYQDITQRRHSELALVEAIEAVMKDASWFSRSIMDKLATLRTPSAGAPAPPQTELSRREREVLELIAHGADDRAIAERLGLSGNTVRNHVSRLYAKIGVNRRSAAVIWARERGIGAGQQATMPA